MTREFFKEQPDSVWIEATNEKQGAPCLVHFAEDIEEVEENGVEEKTYEADVYTVLTSYRENLLETVTKDREVWLAAAKAAETEESKKTLEERVTELEERQDDMILSMLGE